MSRMVAPGGRGGTLGLSSVWHSCCWESWSATRAATCHTCGWPRMCPEGTGQPGCCRAPGEAHPDDTSAIPALVTPAQPPQSHWAFPPGCAGWRGFYWWAQFNQQDLISSVPQPGLWWVRGCRGGVGTGVALGTSQPHGPSAEGSRGGSGGAGQCWEGGQCCLPSLPAWGCSPVVGRLGWGREAPLVGGVTPVLCPPSRGGPAAQP